MISPISEIDDNVAKTAEAGWKDLVDRAILKDISLEKIRIAEKTSKKIRLHLSAVIEI